MKRMPCTFTSLALAASLTLGASASFADVAVTDAGTFRSQARAANLQKKADKQLRRSKPASAGGVSTLGTGSQALTDSSGFEFFINTDVTFSTTSSASGAVSEASYTGPVDATTSGGGVVSDTLSDAFDGYYSIWLSQTQTGQPSTGNADFLPYNDNGAATVDATCAGRQLLFANETIFGLTVSRKVFVPANDTFARWQTILTNPTAAAITVNVIAANNLGSDANTVVDSSSSGDATATPADYWISTFQNYSGTVSSDPRLAHVLWGPGGTAPNAVHFANGDDNPYWSIPVTVPAGETRIVLHFVTGQPSRAAARAKAALLAANPLPPTALACISEADRASFANFAATAAGEAAVPSLGLSGLLSLLSAIAAAGFVAARRTA